MPKQTWKSQFKVCCIMYDLLLLPGMKRLKGVLEILQE